MHAATKNYLRCNSPIITKCARAVVKMAGKLAMLAVLLSCKRMCVSELRSLAYNVCNLSVRRCAVDKFSARHGKQSQTTEKKHKRCARTSEKEATNEVATEKEIDQALQVPLATPQQELYVYTCPFCQGSVTTSTASGHINHRRVCGKQFRVQDGLLRPTLPTIRYSHTCPTCGTCVQSTKKFGRIQSKHKQPSGRMCRLTQWHAS